MRLDKSIYDSWEMIQFKNNQAVKFDDVIAVEAPITFIVNGEEFATIVCTPNNIRELVIGFLASEGIIRFSDEIKSIHIDDNRGFAYIELTKQIEKVNHAKRVINSCCGISRQFYFKGDVQTARTNDFPLPISPQQCLDLMDQLQDAAQAFKKTGGFHTAGLCTADELVQVRTDIGRHNALDKIHGYMFENQLSTRDKLIVFSGRISSEVLLKVSKMGIAVIISTSAPTNLALKLAVDLGITAVGFTRGKKMNIYTHPERIMGERK